MADKTNKVQFIYTVNSSEYNQNMKAMQQQTKLTAQQLKTVATDIKNEGTSIGNLRQQQQLLISQIGTLNSTFNKQKEAMANTVNKMNENKKALDELKQKKQQLNQQYKDSVRQYGKESEEAKKLDNELKKVTTEYNEMNNKVKQNVNNLNNQQRKMETTKQNISNYTAQLKTCNQALADHTNKLLIASNKLSKMSTGFSSVGGAMSGIGNALLKVTAPLVAFSAYSVKAGIDFEASMSDVQGTASLTSEEVKTLGDKAKQLGRDIKGASSKEVADSYKYLALAGQDANTMLTTIEPNVKASIAWNEDMKHATDMTTDSMSALGIATEKTNYYLDVMTKAQNSSNTTAIQLEEAYIACGNTLKNMHVPLEEASTILGGMANQGIKGSEAGNGLNSVLINLMGTTDKTSGALEKMNVKAYDGNGKFRGLHVVLEDCKKSMSKMTDEQKDMIAAALGGKTRLTEFEAMLNVTGSTYDDLYGKISNYDGALEKMYSTMTDNTKGGWTEMKDKLESLGLTVAEDLLPVCNDFIHKLDEIVDWFSELDSGTRQAILKYGLLTTATGGLLKVTGGLATTFGSALGGLSKFAKWIGTTTGLVEAATATTEALGTATTVTSGSFAVFSSVLLPLVGILGLAAGAVYSYDQIQKAHNSTILDAKDDMGFLEKAYLELSGVQRYSKEELENMGYKWKEFSSDITPETQKQLESTADKFRDIKKTIEEVNIDTMITNEEQQNVKNKIKDVCDDIKAQLKGVQSEAKNTMENTFMVDGVIDENERKILEGMDAGGKEITAKIEDIQKRANEIMDSGHFRSAEGQRELNDLMLQLQDLYSKQYIVKEKANQQDIEAFRSRSNKISLEEASKSLEEQKKLADEQTNIVHDKYDKTITLLKNELGKHDNETDKAIRLEIDRYKQQREQEIKIAQQKYNGMLDVIKKNHPELARQISHYDGTILSEQGQRNQQYLQQLQAQYENMYGITETGMYKVKNKITGEETEIFVKVDEKTGQIIGCYDTRSRRAGAMTEEIANSLRNEASAWDGATQNMVGNTWIQQNCSINSSKQIVDANGRVVGSLGEVRKNSDDTKTSIVDLNGHPVQISYNDHGVITKLREVDEAVNRINNRKAILHLDVDGTNFKNKLADALAGVPDEFKGKLWGHATGGSINQDQLSFVNENGWELFNNNVTSVGTMLGNGIAKLNSGTQVSNHLSSVAQMKAEVGQEVSKQTQQALNIAFNGIAKLIDSKLNTNSEVTLRKEDISKLTDAIRNIQLQANIESRSIARATAKDMDIELGRLNSRNVRRG